MPQATITRAWKTATHAHLAVTVAESENGQPVAIEYIGTLPMTELVGTPAQQKALLVAAVKAKRDAQQTAASTDISGISGQVTI